MSSRSQSTSNPVAAATRLVSVVSNGGNLGGNGNNGNNGNSLPRYRSIVSPGSTPQVSPPPSYIERLPSYGTSPGQEQRRLLYLPLAELDQIRNFISEQLSRVRRSIRDQQSYEGYSLIEATRSGNFQAVRYLINVGQDLDQDDYNRNTPLHIAAERGYDRIAELLVRKGALIDRNNGYGQTALYLATSQGNLPLVQLLVEAGANVNWTDYQDQPILSVATGEIAQYLREHGARGRILNAV